jgi:hypothetical protein
MAEHPSTHVWSVHALLHTIAALHCLSPPQAWDSAAQFALVQSEQAVGMLPLEDELLTASVPPASIVVPLEELDEPLVDPLDEPLDVLPLLVDEVMLPLEEEVEPPDEELPVPLSLEEQAKSPITIAQAPKARTCVMCFIGPSLHGVTTLVD